MAGWLIDECATGPGIGGMVTFGMGDFLGWITRTDDVFQTTRKVFSSTEVDFAAFCTNCMNLTHFFVSNGTLVLHGLYP